MTPTKLDIANAMPEKDKVAFANLAAQGAVGALVSRVIAHGVPSVAKGLSVGAGGAATVVALQLVSNALTPKPKLRLGGKLGIALGAGLTTAVLAKKLARLKAAKDLDKPGEDTKAYGI